MKCFKSPAQFHHFGHPRTSKFPLNLDSSIEPVVAAEELYMKMTSQDSKRDGERIDFLCEIRKKAQS